MKKVICSSICLFDLNLFDFGQYISDEYEIEEQSDLNTEEVRIGFNADDDFETNYEDQSVQDCQNEINISDVDKELDLMNQELDTLQFSINVTEHPKHVCNQAEDMNLELDETEIYDLKEEKLIIIEKLNINLGYIMLFLYYL